VEEARRDAGLTPEPIFFGSPSEFYDWLERHHDTDSEVYVGYWKKGSGRPSLTWSQAVDQALCFGWIDGRANSIDAERYMQRFTPRKPRSNWSRINIEKVAKLRQEGLMRPAGLRAFEARTEDRSGVYAFEQQTPAELPPEYQERLRANTAAWDHWQARPAGYRRTASHWVLSAKRADTRERRLGQLIECSAEGRPVPPLRRPEKG
jgi:uncharacterized protein YdeI (YjbR/CyaY-like superfamily)